MTEYQSAFQHRRISVRIPKSFEFGHDFRIVRDPGNMESADAGSAELRTEGFTDGFHLSTEHFHFEMLILSEHFEIPNSSITKIF